MFSSVRHPEHVRQALLAGAHVCTVPFGVMNHLCDNSLTAVGTEQFQEHMRLMTMKVGDLVRAKANHCLLVGWRNNKDKAVGLVIKARYGAIDRDHMSYRVRWSGDYGTFWSCIQDLEVINENR